VRIRGPRPKLWRGYRNCDKCSRWRPVSDYTVYKTRTGYEQITSECDHCKREREKARYDKLSETEKRSKGIKANKRAMKRRSKALVEIERLHAIVDEQNERLEEQWAKIEQVRKARKHARATRGTINGTAVDIVPFRMWLLRQYRQYGYNSSELAREMGQDEARVRRWLDGFLWTGAGRDPEPIRAINLATVDQISMAMGDSGLLSRLYPLEDDTEDHVE
jgi:hypothetical protein